MKTHKTVETCLAEFDLSNKTIADAFRAGWFAAAAEINNGYDSDDLQEQLQAAGFLDEQS